ncbi:DUF3800 domain-containing protein [Faecalibaculum rodentium]|uniref:DUF3800 domain-containing protein n=1 Tax=Faecalibaculum rodentium TaxID=1702221 RepID=A0A140DWX7_9FIRM|nr:DUF3800 domain-containing protein [Faecalibaculum rodentium]AMK55154.1 hypothetical protein AALO17_20200 [Faecalibaculum rodentium]
MNLFVYADESGVFDKQHHSWYAFGGVLFLSKSERDSQNRKYISLERKIRRRENIDVNQELKGSNMSRQSKRTIFSSLNHCIKFGCIIQLNRCHDELFTHKKTKQRYLDYAFKIGLKRLLEKMIKEGKITPHEIENMYVFFDEHSTATDGKYELSEGLLQEFKYGTFNSDWQRYFPPLFPEMKSLQLSFCNSESQALIRAADIVANRIHYEVTVGRGTVPPIQSLHLTYLP